MKDLYKRFYTQQEVESYEISKLENLLESGRKYPFNRHSGGYSILVPMIATTTLFVGGVYAETKDQYSLIQCIQYIITDLMRLSEGNVTMGVILNLLWFMGVWALPILLLLYFCDRKLAKHRNAFYHKNVAMLQDELTRKKDAQALYQGRLAQAQKELTEKASVIKKELEEKYDIQF